MLGRLQNRWGHMLIKMRWDTRASNKMPLRGKHQWCIMMMKISVDVPYMKRFLLRSRYRILQHPTPFLSHIYFPFLAASYDGKPSRSIFRPTCQETTNLGVFCARPLLSSAFLWSTCNRGQPSPLNPLSMRWRFRMQTAELVASRAMFSQANTTGIPRGQMGYLSGYIPVGLKGKVELGEGT